MSWQPPEEYFDDVKKTGWQPPEEYFDDSPTKINDVGTLQQMKQSGKELSRDQEKVLFDAEDAKPISQKASEAISTFVPTAIDIAKQLGTGAGEFLYKGVLKPIDAMSQSPEEADKTLKEAKNTWRSFASGVAGDIQETADAAVRFSMFGSNITDKLLGRSNEERFEKYMLREGMRQFAQKVYEDDPDNAARLLAENPLLQKLASAAALAQGATAEEAELAKKAYEDLVKEQGLTKEEINENVSLLGEIMSPIALPGTNRITNTFGKVTGKVTQKAGELALKGVVAPLAKGVAKTAGGVETGIEAIQTASRKIGEYTVGDPDTFVRSAANTFIALPAKLPAKMTRGIATTIADVAGQAGPGRRGMFERAGRAATAGDLTKKLFSPESMGGKGRAKAADWAVRQSNAIIQPAVNGAVLNVALGLPDIETARDLGYSGGVGFGIGAYGGARLMERGGALIDPTTGLAEKIDAIVTPDPAQLRKDQDADIQRFVQTADPTLMSSIDELSNVNNIKSALDLKIKNLEAKKAAQIRKEDEKRIQDQIDIFTQQRKGLDKSTPQTEAEIKRQVQLSFADAMDLAKTTGAAAGLNNIQVKVLRPDQMEDFYRDLYGKTLTDAESVVRQLVGNPSLSPSEQELLNRADQTIKQYLQDVAGASTARGFAISERTGQPDHLKLQNQKGATVVINGDLVAQMGRDGLNLGRVINHEMQHALSNFQEVREMLAPIRKELFDQKILNPDGTFESVSKGIVSDADLDKFALQYAAAMDASGGASFLSQFANQDQLRNYMKEEYLSELAGLSGGIQGNLRGNLDSVGRSVVDWIETKTKNGALKRIKEGLRNYGVVVDDQGQFSSVIGAQLNPEAMAMMRQYQRGLRDLNESLVYNSDPIKDEAEIPLTELATNRVLQERYKHSDFFEQEQVVKMTTPDGQVQEIVVPPGVKVDSFVSDYRFANGQLVDEQGNPISLGPDIPLQAMPDGTSISVDTRIARNADGSPLILSPRESKRRAKKRGEAIRKVIDEAADDDSGVRLEDTGNGNYRGTLSPTQIAAINALPNDLVAPSLKRKIAFFNDILGRKDGSIVEIEYQAAMRDKKYRALQPQMRTEIPIGFQFDKQGNFLMTTMSMSRMHDKANAWAAKRPRNLRLWGGDMTKFWDSVRQYLHNHKAGLQGHINLHPDPAIAMEMKNRINDLFNVYRKETREANPERTTLPKRRGQDSMDVVIRSRRMDRINSYDETAMPKMPFQYELAVQNYLPAENPFAELQTPEQFARGMEIDTELARLAAQGNVEPLELQLHEQDLLRPAEYVDVQDGKLRVRSMFDPTQAVFEPGESEPEKPSLEVVETEVEMPQATQLIAAEAPSDAEFENNESQYIQSLKDRIRSGTAFSNAVVAPAGIQFLPAFHGSPYDFDEFSTSKIGSGEGNQAYGYGLYFAGLRDIGEGYRKKLSTEVRVDGVFAPKEEDLDGSEQVTEALSNLVSVLKQKKNGLQPDKKLVSRSVSLLESFQSELKENDSNYVAAEKILNWWFNHGIKGLKDESKIQDGTLYKVDLDVDDSNLLDWDKPLSEQSKSVQDAVLPTIIDQFDKIKKAREQIIQRGTRLGGKPFRPGELEQLQKPMRDPLTMTGKGAYIHITNAFGGRPTEDAPKASNFLLSRGVAGIRYFDALSRGAGEGTHNYVVFDDKLIKILEKDDKPVGPVIQFMPAESDFEQIRRDAIDKRNKRRDEAYEILYSVIPETADILKRKTNFEDDQQEFNSIPFSMPSVGFDYDRSFHLTKIVRRILDTLDPMADTRAIQNLRRKWDSASPMDKQGIEDRIKKYEDRIKKTASTMKYAFGVFADLTASLPEAKARDLRQDKIVDPWVVLKKHFPNGESKDINKVILELRDVIKFGIEKENFKNSINNVLNAAEVLRDFTDVDQSVIDQLFKDRYNKSEAQMKESEEEFLKEVTNPEFFDVEKTGSAIISQKIQPQGDIRFMPAEPQGMEDVEMPQTYRRISDMIPPLQGVEPPVAPSALPAEPETPATPALPKQVEKTMKADAGDFSVVIGGKPGKYGFEYTSVVKLQPELKLSEQRKKELLEALVPRNEEFNKKRDALMEIGNLWWENNDLLNKQNKSDKDRKRMVEIDQVLQEFMAKEDKEFTIDDATQVAQVDRLTKKINELQRGMTPAPFKFPVDNREVLTPVEKPADINPDASKEDKAKYAKELAAYEAYVDLVKKQKQDVNIGLKSLQGAVATLFKTKKFKEFIAGAAGLSGIQFDNIFGTWKFEAEPSFVFSAPGMTWDQAQTITKWLSVLMTQDAGIAWKPSIGLTEGAPSVYLVHDKKLTEDQILKAFEKAKEVGIDGLSVTVDGKGIKAANFDGIDKFEDKLIEIQKASNIKNINKTLVDSFYYDTTSDFTADDGSLKVPDWIKGESINEENTQDQQGGISEAIQQDTRLARGFPILLRRGIDSVLVPYAKALAGEGFTFDPDRFAERYGLGQEVADYIREQLYPSTGLSRSVTPILEGTEKFVVPESFYTKDGKLKTSVNDLLYALQRRSADDGFINPGDYSPRAGQIISETIVDEVVGHMERAKQNPDAPNAIGWYDAALKRMKAEYAKYFPFLNRNSKDYNADKEFVFDSVLGITSQGNNVFENGKMAARIQFLLENGKTLPEIASEEFLYDTFGGQTRAIENNLLKLDELLKNNDTQTLDKIFRKKMTVSKWNEYLKKNKNLYFKGEPLSVDGQADQMVTGFSVFGPKIGSFINNLHGDYSTLTADLWFTRTWNRILGNVFQHASLKEANQYDAFRKALLEQYRKNKTESYQRKFDPLVKKINKEGKEVLFDYFNETELEGLSENEFGELINDPQKMLDFATALEDRFRSGQYKTKSDLRRAAKNWIENRSDPVAAPRTDLERDFQQNVMEIAQKKLRRKGIDISIADMQAALWYNEKELFGLYGAQVSGAEPADYADSAENVSELMSYGTLFQLERLVEQEDGTKKKEIIRLVPYDTELGLTKIKNAKTPEAYVQLVAARKKAIEDAKKADKKLEKAETKVEETRSQLAKIDPTDAKAKQKAEAALAKAEKLLADLKPPVATPVAPLTGIKSPVE